VVGRKAVTAAATPMSHGGSIDISLAET
jgi:hypothetical protein